MKQLEEAKPTEKHRAYNLKVEVKNMGRLEVHKTLML